MKSDPSMGLPHFPPLPDLPAAGASAPRRGSGGLKTTMIFRKDTGGTEAGHAIEKKLADFRKALKQAARDTRVWVRTVIAASVDELRGVNAKLDAAVDRVDHQIKNTIDPLHTPKQLLASGFDPFDSESE